MEAKDTVMGFAKQSAEMNKAKVRAGCLIRKQAEISFKAGIKEVVDFILAHSQLERCDPDVMTYFIDYLAIDYPDWQAKLKEWGIE